jgi:chromosomal replication initiation ATPase DnaA
MISKETAEVIISEIEKKIGIKNMMSNNRTSLYVDARRILFYILRYRLLCILFNKNVK